MIFKIERKGHFIGRFRQAYVMSEKVLTEMHNFGLHFIAKVKINFSKFFIYI